MNIAACQGQKTPGDKILMLTGTSCHFVICCKFQKHLFEVWFYTMFFMILYMYIAPGQGQTAHRGQNFNADRNVLSLHSFIASLKMSLKSDFKRFCFFHDLVHVHSPGAWADSPQGTNFDFTRMALSLFLFVASFKEIFLKSYFIHFFSLFYTCI